MKIDMKEALMKLAYTGGESSDFLLEVDNKGNTDHEEVEVTELKTIKAVLPEYYINSIATCCEYVEEGNDTNECDRDIYYTCNAELYLATYAKERFYKIKNGEKVDLPLIGARDIYFIIMSTDLAVTKAEEGFVHSEKRKRPALLSNSTKKREPTDITERIKNEFDEKFEVIANRFKDIYNK